MQYRNFLFDCDGVLLDSNTFKVKAMEVSLKGYPEEKIKGFLDYFLRNFGKSRYQHIQILFEKYLKRTPTASEANAIIDSYAKQCKVEYMRCQMCEGALELLETLDPDRTWVVSGSDQAELRDVFERRNVAKYFNEIFGSPTSKANNIHNILKQKQLNRSETCLIGDAQGDYEAAKANGISFIFCKKYSNTPELEVELKKDQVIVVESLAQLQDLIPPQK